MAQGSSPREPLGEPDLSLLSAYLDDELSDAERAQLEARLGADAALQAELEALRQTVALVRSLPEIPVPRNFTLDPAQYGRRQPGGWWFSLATPMLAAGASLLVVAVCVGVLLTGGGLGRQAAPLLAPAAGEAPSVAEADFAAEEAAPAEEEPAEEEAARAFEMAEEEPAAEEGEFFAEEAEEAAPALEAPAPTAEIGVEGAETGVDAVGEAESEMAAEPEPLAEEPEEEEAVSEEQEAPAEEEAPVEEVEAGAVTRQPTAIATATPAPQPTLTPPAEIPEATEVSGLPEPDVDAADEAAAPPAEPAVKADDAGALAQGAPDEAAPQAFTPQVYAPSRPSRVIPLLIGAVIVLGAALLVAGIILTLAKRRR